MLDLHFFLLLSYLSLLFRSLHHSAWSKQLDASQGLPSCLQEKLSCRAFQKSYPEVSVELPGKKKSEVVHVSCHRSHCLSLSSALQAVHSLGWELEEKAGGGSLIEHCGDVPSENIHSKLYLFKYLFVFLTQWKENARSSRNDDVMGANVQIKILQRAIHSNYNSAMFKLIFLIHSRRMSLILSKMS